MSSTLVENLVNADQGAIEFDRSNPGLFGPTLIFTVPVGSPARIEAVFCFMDAGNQTIAVESLVLFYQQANGDIIWVGPSPVFIGQNVSTGYVSWARGNQDTAQFAAYNQAPDDDTPPLFSNPALPDVVLPPNATLGLAYNAGADTNTGTMTVSQITVTYTVGTGPTSTVAPVNVLPLLTPTDEG